MNIAKLARRHAVYVVPLAVAASFAVAYSPSHGALVPPVADTSGEVPIADSPMPPTTTSAAVSAAGAHGRSHPRHHRWIRKDPTISAPTTVNSPGAGAGKYGVPPGTTLTPSGSINVDKPGTVVDAKDVKGSIQVSATGVVVKNTRITCGSGDRKGINIASGASVSITDVEITGSCADGAIEGQDFSLDGADIHNVPADGIKIDGGNVTIQNSTLRAFTPGAGAHADGIQAAVPIANVGIRNNVIDVGKTSSGEQVNSALFLVDNLSNGSKPGQNIVSGNVLGGGGYTVHIDNAQAGALGQVSMINNIYRRDSVWGPVYKTGFRYTAWTGQKFDDGTPIAAS